MTSTHSPPGSACALGTSGRCGHIAEISAFTLDVGSARDRKDVLDALSLRIRQSLGTSAAYIAVNNGAEAVVCSSQGVVTPPFRTLRLPHRTGLGGAVAADGIARATEDYAHDPRLAHVPDLDRRVLDEGLQSIVAAPVRVGTTVIGAAMGGTRHHRRFGPHEIAVLEALCGIAGTAIAHHGSLQIAQQRLQDSRRSVDELREIVRHQLDLLASGTQEALIEHRAVLVADLVRGRLDEHDYRVRARACGLDPRQHYAVLAIAPGQEMSRTSLDTDNGGVTLPDGLVGTIDDHGHTFVLALTPSASAASPTSADKLAELLGIHNSPTIAVAGPAAGAVGLHDAIREAVRTLRLMRGLGRIGVVGRSARLGPLGVLASGTEPGELRSLLDKTLAPLASVDPDRHDRLLVTLAAWFDNDGSVKRTARGLGVHVNTVYGRLDMLDELFGLGWRSGRRRLELETAVRLHLLGTDMDAEIGQE